MAWAQPVRPIEPPSRLPRGEVRAPATESLAQKMAPGRREKPRSAQDRTVGGTARPSSAPSHAGFDGLGANGYRKSMHVRAVFAGFNLAPPEGWHWKFLTVVWL